MSHILGTLPAICLGRGEVAFDVVCELESGAELSLSVTSIVKAANRGARTIVIDTFTANEILDGGHTLPPTTEVVLVNHTGGSHVWNLAGKFNTVSVIVSRGRDAAWLADRLRPYLGL